jgi:predicted outer membrane repeat protein
MYQQLGFNRLKGVIMKTATVLVAVLFIPVLAFTDTIYVPDDYPTIQGAIDASVNGDTIIVRPGKYVENINFRKKAIHLKSECGASETIINVYKKGVVVTCHSGEGPDTVLDGFTIMNGRESSHGAGMLNESSSPTVIHCTFTFNSASHGGGMYNMNSNPTIDDCIFTKNEARYQDGDFGASGGGMLNVDSNPIVTNCSFISNYADDGGGMHNDNSSPLVSNCLFNNNQVYFDGGAMRNVNNSNPIVENCTFFYNSAKDYGGGMADSENSSPTVAHCTFTKNSAGLEGGGIRSISVGQQYVTFCTFSENSAMRGGGIRNYCETIVMDCNFYGNYNTSGYGDPKGGGIYISNDTSLVTNCVFTVNSSLGEGGGMFLNNFNDYSATVSNCIFNNNQAYWSGGGIYVEGGSSTITNCTFTMNYAKGGGGMAFYKNNPTVTNCTFCENEAENGGGGLRFYDSDSVMINTVLWNNSAPEGPEMWLGKGIKNSKVTISYSDVKGGEVNVYVDYPSILNWGAGMIDADPLFVDEADGDFHLTYLSPCKDTGDNSVVTELFDPEGDPRIAYGNVDMGSDEFYTHLYCMGDFTPGGAIEGKLVGLPGTAPVGLFFGSGVLDPPVPTAWGNFHLQAPWFMIPLIPIPGDGVLVLPATIPTTPPAPYDLPMQALIGLEPDSLSNLFVLEVR